MGVKETVDQLQLWVKVKRQRGLSDAHVQMARELGMNPRRVLEADKAGQEPLARRIEVLYLKRFKRPLPDAVAPLRQLLHDARARERAEAHERRQRKRQAEIDHAEAARISLLTLHRLCNAIGLERAEIPYADDDHSGRPPMASN
jgi:hypothetical protein